MADIDQSKSYTIQELAERLGVSKSTIRRLIREGAFPNAYKVGFGRTRTPIRIPEEDVLAFEESRRLFRS